MNALRGLQDELGELWEVELKEAGIVSAHIGSSHQRDAVEKAMKSEVADIFAIFLHYCIMKGITPAELERLTAAKMLARWEWPDEYKKSIETVLKLEEE